MLISKLIGFALGHRVLELRISANPFTTIFSRKIRILTEISKNKTQYRIALKMQSNGTSHDTSARL